MKQKYKFIVLAVVGLSLGALLGLFVLNSGKQAEPQVTEPSFVMPTIAQVFIERNAQLQMVSGASQYNVGDKIAIEVFAELDKYGVIGVDVVLKHSESLVFDYVDTSGEFDMYPLAKSADSSTVRISGLVDLQNQPVTGNVLVATVYFDAVQAGDAILEFAFAEGSSVDSNVVEAATAVDRLGEVNKLILTIK